jgi:hypothetical protein
MRVGNPQEQQSQELLHQVQDLLTLVKLQLQPQPQFLPDRILKTLLVLWIL